MCAWRRIESEPEAPRTPKIEPFDFINDEQQKQKIRCRSIFPQLAKPFGYAGEERQRVVR